MIGSGTNLVMTIIGFGMSATFIVFVCMRLLCGRIRMVESRRAMQMMMPPDLEVLEHTINGLEAVVVETFPTMKFSTEAFCSKEDAQCPICLGEYQDKEMLRMMPTCGHAFHLTCIDVWLEKQSTCPVCRLSLQNYCEGKWSMPPMFNSPEATEEHSYQGLLPGSELSVITESLREHHEFVPRIVESTRVRESETRR